MFGRARRNLIRCCGRSTRDQQERRREENGNAPVPRLPKLDAIHEGHAPSPEEEQRQWLDLVEPENMVILTSHSFAANDPCEDTFCVFQDPFGVFVAIFDGHGGVAAASMCEAEAHAIFMNHMGQNPDPEKALARMILELDRMYLDKVELLCESQEGSSAHLRHLGAGTCALAAYIDKRDGLLHVANLGDSRAILGKACSLQTVQYGPTVLMEAVEVTVDHSIKTDAERHRIREEQHDDKNVIIERWDDYEYAWLLKGRARFSRSIGDVIFKDADSADFYNSCIAESEAHRRMEPLPMDGRPYLSNKAEVTSRRIVKGDFFFVLACDGLWDEMTSDQVVRVVQCLVEQYGPKANIAQLLTQFVLSKVAQRLAVEEPELEIYTDKDLEAQPPGPDGRRELHDDITIVVMLFDQRYLVSDKAPGTVSTATAGANTPLVECTPACTPRTDRTENSQASLLAAADNVELLLTIGQVPALPLGQLGAGGSWFGSSLLSKAPYEDVRKAVERLQPSQAETHHSNKSRAEAGMDLRSESPSPPPKKYSALSPSSARELLGAHGSPTNTLSSESSPRRGGDGDGGDTTRSCTVTETTTESAAESGRVSQARARLLNKRPNVGELNTTRLRASNAGLYSDAQDTGRSVLDTGRSLASIDEEGDRVYGLPSELADLGFTGDSGDEQSVTDPSLSETTRSDEPLIGVTPSKRLDVPKVVIAKVS